MRVSSEGLRAKGFEFEVQDSEFWFYVLNLKFQDSVSGLGFRV